MPRYLKVSKGKECHVKYQNGVLVMKRCRTIKGKKEVQLKEILKELGIESI